MSPVVQTPGVVFVILLNTFIFLVQILEREADWRRRGIREAIYVKRGGLRCALSPVWDRPLGVKSVRASRPEDGIGIGRN